MRGAFLNHAPHYLHPHALTTDANRCKTRPTWKGARVAKGDGL